MGRSSSGSSGSGGGGGGVPPSSTTTASASASASASANLLHLHVLARQGPPRQKPPTKSTFDLHARQILLRLSQSQTGIDAARYDKLSDEDARLVRRCLGRTVRALERRQERKKKSKSSGVAADALDFYRHVLTRARKIRGLPVDEEEDLQEEELLLLDSEDESDEDDDDEDSSDEESSSSSGSSDEEDDEESAGSEEFLNAHNDLCEVCDGVGDEDQPLLCCATCTLVFHQDCHRPVLVKEPPDNWSCAYCDDAGVTLHKRDSRERKRASRGVREMRKMMEEREADAGGGGAKNDGTDDGDGDDKQMDKAAAKDAKSSPKAVRDPTTGRFKSPEEVAASAAAAAAAGDKDEEEESQEDRSDLTAEELARLGGNTTTTSTCATTPPPKDSPQSTEEGSGASRTQRSSTSKHQLKGSELRLLLDTMSPEDVDLSGPRARRQRRQAPALYDPGDMGGDMDWRGKDSSSDRKKDGGGKAEAEGEVEVGNKKRKRELLVIGKKKKRKKNSSSSRTEKREAKRRRKEEKRKKREDKRKNKQQKKTKKNTKRKKMDKSALPPNEKEGANCHMCYDDDRVEVCLFCACRICFSKLERETESTLICDGCDAEYHTNCLDPPLLAIPEAEEEWFCPACLNVEVRRAKAAAERKAKAAKKSPGKSQVSASATPRKRALQKAKEQGEATKKARTLSGRSSPTAAAYAAGAMLDSPGDWASPSGTIPAHASTPGQGVAQRSRSGRKVKRTPFHDEIDDGAQHLASSLRSVGETGKLQLHKMTAEETHLAHGVNAFSATTAAAAGAVAGAKPPPQGSVGPSTQGRTHIAALNAASGATTTGPRALAGSHPLASDQGARYSYASAKTPLSIAVPKSSGRIWGPGSSFPYEYVPPPQADTAKSPRRKPGARECLQLAKRLGVQIIPEQSVGVLVDYCKRGKLEHLIRMRERLDDHSRFLELQLAELELLVKKKGELKVTVPPARPVGFSGGASPRGTPRAGSPHGAYRGVGGTPAPPSPAPRPSSSAVAAATAAAAAATAAAVRAMTSRPPAKKS